MHIHLPSRPFLTEPPEGYIDIINNIDKKLRFLKMFTFMYEAYPHSPSLDEEAANYRISGHYILYTRCTRILNEFKNKFEGVSRDILSTGLSEIGNLPRDMSMLYDENETLFNDGLYIDGFDTLFYRIYVLVHRVFRVQINQTNGSVILSRREDATLNRVENVHHGILICLKKLIVLTYKFRQMLIDEYHLQDEYPPVQNMGAHNAHCIIEGIDELYQTMS